MQRTIRGVVRTSEMCGENIEKKCAKAFVLFARDAKR